MKLLYESFRLHKQLNQKLFDENNNLKEDIRNRLIEIADVFVHSLQENNVPIQVIDYWLLGSNAAYNYNPDSDIDVHIIVNTEDIKVDDYLLKLVYEYAKSTFNSKYDIKVKGHEVELYVEDIKSGAVSNGIYSLLKNEWIKEPTRPEEEKDLIIEETDLYKEWIERYRNLKDDEIENFINDLYILRKVSLMQDGEFGAGNLVFKQFRNNGYLDELKERKIKQKSKELTLEKLEEKKELKEELLKVATPYMIRNDGKIFDCSPLHPYINYHPEFEDKQAVEDALRRLKFFEWFYDHTNEEITKRDIKQFLKSVFETDYFNVDKEEIENCDIDLSNAEPIEKEEDIIALFKELNDATNQEFLRARTSSMKFGGKSGDVYFRVSSTDFDWFPIIWKIVYDNRNFITSVTICTDTQSRGGVVKFYNHSGVSFNQIPVDEFLSLSGNPIIENKESEIFKLRYGKGLVESFQDIHPAHIHNCFETLVNSYIKRNFK